MKTPTIHLNGTPGEALFEQTCGVLRALRRVLDAMAEASPNARDYYPQGEGAIGEASREHGERMQRVNALIADYERLAEVIRDAIDERNAARAPVGCSCSGSETGAAHAPWCAYSADAKIARTARLVEGIESALAPLARGTFVLDDTPAVDGYHDPRDTWNGWAQPFVTRETMCVLLDAWEDADHGLREAADGRYYFIDRTATFADGPAEEEIEPVTRETVDGPRELYAVGLGYTWSVALRCDGCGTTEADELEQRVDFPGVGPDGRAPMLCARCAGPPLTLTALLAPLGFKVGDTGGGCLLATSLLLETDGHAWHVWLCDERNGVEPDRLEVDDPEIWIWALLPSVVDSGDENEPTLIVPWSRVRANVEACLAEACLVALVRAIGPGFHPDTPAEDYRIHRPDVAADPQHRALEDELLALYEPTIDYALETGLDVYAIGAPIVRRLLEERKGGAS